MNFLSLPSYGYLIIIPTLYVLPALQNSLKCLGLDYLDPYLVHCPMSAKPEIRKFAYEEHELMPFDMKGVWASMEQCHNLGLTKSIGVSNFSTKKLEHLSFPSIPPAVNQVELNPSWQQKNLREYCRGKGIVVTAYSPLGARGTEPVTVVMVLWTMNCSRKLHMLMEKLWLR
ncbi:Deoxymugineic acid synthase 1-D [Stylosanthes scabra]|uniref:Deoxymugineic acid synthase 1-D n=1 Tax=Stylosanthes scabra TaxID=79078 RepID=A0ABU6XFY1_9FABA|nr:Deoxymugineic acid synthase 1-D [Stylosanthes scabra]